MLLWTVSRLPFLRTSTVYEDCCLSHYRMMDLQFYKEWSDSLRRGNNGFLEIISKVFSPWCVNPCRSGSLQASFCRFTLNKMALNCFVAACATQINKLNLNLTASYFLTMAVQTFSHIGSVLFKKKPSMVKLSDYESCSRQRKYHVCRNKNLST